MTRRHSPPSTPKVPALSVAEQTRLSWAQFIGSNAAVPKVFQGFFEPILAEGRAFPYAVLTPSYEGFLHRTTEHLICDFGHEITILERRGQGFDLKSYPLERISFVQVTAILLDTRIKISGITRQGVPSSSSLKFNSVTDYLFTPILENIRLATVHPRDEVLSSELEKFDQWAGVNYKFMNYAKHSLVGGEKVIQAMLQAEIRAGEFTLMGRTFYRRISPTHMTILTDRELIVVLEEGSKAGVDRYGGTWHYMPLKEVIALSISRKGALLALSIQLPQDARIERLFQPSAKLELDQLLDRFRELSREYQTDTTEHEGRD